MVGIDLEREVGLEDRRGEDGGADHGRELVEVEERPGAGGDEEVHVLELAARALQQPTAQG